jgi:hypothetical protein
MIYFLLGILAAFAALAAIPALADEPRAPEYPPGLFENSPLVGSDPGAPAPDALTIDPAPDDCADIASRLFHSLAEVKAAHARCDDRIDPGEPQ